MSSNELMISRMKGHSSDVRMDLITNGRTFPLSQIGPTKIKLRDHAEIPAGPGEINLYVDGVLNAWTVDIKPAEPGAKWVPIERPN